MKRFNLLLILPVFLFIISSCGSDEDVDKLKEPVADSFSKYLKTEKNVAFFGKLNPKTIIQKTNYKNEIKSFITGLIATYEQNLNTALDTQEPVYVAINGPLEKNGPSRVVIFAKGKSKDDFRKTIEKDLARAIKEVDGMLVAESDDFQVAYKDQLVVFIVDEKLKDVSGEFKKIYDVRNGQKSGGKVDQILAISGDIVGGADFEGLLATSNTSIKDLPNNKQSEINELAKDSYAGVVCNFKNGEFEIITKHLFNAKLHQNMIFGKPDNGEILSEINNGEGEAAIGLSMNCDVTKMNRTMNNFFPGFLDALFGNVAEEVGGVSFLLQMLDGRLGFIAAPDLVNYGVTANWFIGSNPLASSIGSQVIEDQLKSKINEGMSSKVYSTEKGVHGTLTWQSDASGSNGKITLPASASNFGKSSVTAFIDLTEVPIDGFLPPDLRWLEKIKSISIDGGNDGFHMVLKTKDTSKNILQTALGEAMRMFQSLMVM